MPIRILYLLRNYAMGGAQRVVQLLMNHMPRKEFQIIYVPYETGSPHDQAFIDSLQTLNLPVAQERIQWRGLTDWSHARGAIAEYARKYQVDLIHSHDDQSNMLVGAGRRSWPCARVASAYGWFTTPWNLYLRAQYAAERRFALPNCEYVCTVSWNMRDKIVRGGTHPDRVHVIHTGVDVGSFAPRGVREEWRARLGLPQDGVVIGTVSRLSFEKGHHYLLHAARALLPSFPRLYLLFAGQGPATAAIAAQARRLGLADRVRLPGYCEDLPATLETMDVFAIPSILEEGFPTSALEAQASGLPIVASDIGGTRETMDVGVSGLLVPPKDARALAQSLGELLRDPVRRARMGANAREWVRRSFSLESMMDRMAAVYRQASSLRTNTTCSATVS